jgi:hypothetical protein
MAPRAFNYEMHSGEIMARNGNASRPATDNSIIFNENGSGG